MTPEQFRAAYAALGLTQVGVGRFLEVNGRTVRRWASGSAPIPSAASKLLLLMCALKLTPQKVDLILSGLAWPGA